MPKSFFRWLPILLWVIVICFLSFSSLEKISLPSFFSADKIAHVGMYFTLEVLFLLPLKWKTKAFALATIMAIGFSLITELVQHYYIVNRYGEFADFLANLLGISLALLIIARKNKT